MCTMKIGKAYLLTHKPNQNEVEITKCYYNTKDKVKTIKTNPVENFEKMYQN